MYHYKTNRFYQMLYPEQQIQSEILIYHPHEDQ